MRIVDQPNNTDPCWWKDAGLRANMSHILLLYTVVYSLGYDGSLLNGLQALPPWVRDFGAPAGYDLGLISASYYLPKIPMCFVFAWLTDKYGRKCTLWLGGFLMLAGAIVGGTAASRGQLIGSRILIGMGTGSGYIAAASMVPELAHPRLRHFAGSYFLTVYYVGSILAAWITFGMVYYPGASSWAWKIPTFLQGIGPLILLFGCWIIPESPRYLFKMGRESEARAILFKYHANGKTDDKLVLAEIDEIKASLILERAGDAGTWMSFFNSSGGRRRLGIVVLLGASSQLAGNGIISYYLAPVLKSVGITQPAQIAGINGGLAISNWCMSLSGASLVEKFGRRPLVLTSFSGMLFFMLAMTGVSAGYALSGISSVGVAIVPMIFLFMGSYSFAMTPLPSLYVPEVSPTMVRAKSMAILIFSQNVSQTFNQFVNPIALASIKWQYYIVYVCSLILFLTLFYFFFRETRGLTAEQAAVIYESEDVREALLQAEIELKANAYGQSGLDDKESLEHKESA